ncbi:hypothetical protein GUJ93_ZPchr0004g38775 [Zizania palustris]|uniref:Uncharacterized protein n=1 Tax=Zizania palustris TaxID=103762 RepID=A0A8J5T0H7_ZIZPA|nr:hypothetical protein GUJ93_ZPchr0004g38775 [Zizania palustris]
MKSPDEFNLPEGTISYDEMSQIRSQLAEFIVEQRVMIAIENGEYTSASENADELVVVTNHGGNEEEDDPPSDQEMEQIGASNTS